ncbi:DUF3820 family protein [Candidatus Pacearchaeota archaeon]|nr:DUF3820 family protein [Candidatus Pacearchaeota archaeon]
MIQPRFQLVDNSPMPWGKHKGKLMANIPAHYFIFLWDNKMCGKGPVRLYISDNLDDLRKKASK